MSTYTDAVHVPPQSVEVPTTAVVEQLDAKIALLAKTVALQYVDLARTFGMTAEADKNPTRLLEAAAAALKIVAHADILGDKTYLRTDTKDAS